MNQHCRPRLDDFGRRCNPDGRSRRKRRPTVARVPGAETPAPDRFRRRRCRWNAGEIGVRDVQPERRYAGCVD